MPPILEARDLTKSYRLGETTVEALRGVSLTVDEGEFVALMGPSGSGKSTLLQLLGGLDRPSSGEVVLQGETISRLGDEQATRLRRDRTGFVFQFFNLIPLLDVTENVGLPFTIAGADPRSGDIAARIRDVIELVDLRGKEHAKPDQLSAGEQQRVAVARALVTRPGAPLRGRADRQPRLHDRLGDPRRAVPELHRAAPDDRPRDPRLEGGRLCRPGLRRPRRPDPRGDPARPARDPRRDAAHRAARPARPVAAAATADAVAWTRGLTGLAWRSLWARRARTLLTLAGIALGVGVLFAALATNDGIDRSVDRTVRDLVGRADLRISAFAEARPRRTRPSATIRGTAGRRVAAPRIERRTFLAPSGVAARRSGRRSPSWPSTRRRTRRSTTSPGRPRCAGPGTPTALVSERLATADGLAVGSTITLQGLGDPAASTVTIAGILPGGGPLFDATGRTVVITLDEARVVFGPIGISRIDVGLDPGREPRTRWPPPSSGGSRPSPTSSPARPTSRRRCAPRPGAFQALTSLLAAVALFVGAFLIFNTLSMTVAERIREVGLLRAAGATRRQVAGIVLVQALVLGLVGSAARDRRRARPGARSWSPYVRGIASVPLDGLSVPPVRDRCSRSSSGSPSRSRRRSSRPSGPAGSRRSRPSARGRPRRLAGGRARLRWLVVVFAVVAVAGSLAWPARRGRRVAAPRARRLRDPARGDGRDSPFVLAPLARLAGIPFGWFLRTEERLARGAAVRDPSRTALTVGALLVGLAMIVAVGDVAQNARRAANAWLVDVVPGDEIVTSIVPAAIDEDGPGLDARRGARAWPG